MFPGSCKSLPLARGGLRAPVDAWYADNCETARSKGCGDFCCLPGASEFYPMKTTEYAIREIKDRIAAAIGEIDETAAEAHKKANHQRLSAVARELHRCADDLQQILMRIQTR